MNMAQVKNQLDLSQHQHISERDNCVIIYCNFLKLPEMFQTTNKQPINQPTIYFPQLKQILQTTLQTTAEGYQRSHTAQ